jgi:hypothetical protein
MTPDSIYALEPVIYRSTSGFTYRICEIIYTIMILNGEEKKQSEDGTEKYFETDYNQCSVYNRNAWFDVYNIA